MTLTVRAVYEGGVLRPVRPLGLDEGETVEVTVVRAQPAQRSLSEEEVAQRLQAANSLAEWVETTRLLPSDDGGYDILKALNNNRLWSGERPLTPDGSTPS